VRAGWNRRRVAAEHDRAVHLLEHERKGLGGEGRGEHDRAVVGEQLVQAREGRVERRLHGHRLERPGARRARRGDDVGQRRGQLGRRHERHGLAAGAAPGVAPRGGGEALAQHPAEVGDERREAGHQLPEVGLGELEGGCRHRGPHRRGVRLAGDQRDRADHVAAAQLADEATLREHRSGAGLRVLGGHGQLVREPVDDDEHPAAGLALAGQELAGREVAEAHGGGHGRELTRIEPGEERHTLQRGDGHGNPLERRRRPVHAATSASAARSGLPDGSSGSSSTTVIAYGSL
jgi:hypothetical protein